jgi:hypothetical protein
MPLPTLTDAQRREALKKAAKARQARAQLKKDLKSGRKTLKQVLANTSDPIIGRMKVGSLLESLPGVGKARAAKKMQDLEISSSRRVQGLGSNQRENLLKEFS